MSSPSFRAESDLRPLITSHDEQLSLNKMWSISELGRGDVKRGKVKKEMEEKPGRGPKTTISTSSKVA